jgi:hypothetical protein
MPKGKTDFIFQRPGSENWWIKLRSGGQRIEKSLGTPVRAHAEIMALPMIAEHKAKLLEARPRLETTWTHLLEPGREHVAPDGGRILATDRELFHIGPDGSIMRTEPNGAFTPYLTGRVLPARVEFKVFDDFESGTIKEGPIDERPTPAVRTGDDALLETYLKHAGIVGYYEREARKAT